MKTSKIFPLKIGRQLAREYWNRADLHEKNGPAADSFVMFLNRVKEFLASYQQYPDHTVFLPWHVDWFIGMAFDGIFN